jgi:putative ABC transport system substrate-binding protein
MLLTCPITVLAQQPALPVVGYLSSGSERISTERLSMFRRGMSEAGLTEGKNIEIEYRWAEEHYERLPGLASDLVAHHVRVIIVPDGAATAQAAKVATSISKTPVVFAIGTDPVKTGLVASLNHPGGNLTGSSRLNVELAPKRLEILHELVPTAKTVGFLVNPSNPNSGPLSKDMAAAARSLGFTLLVFKASNDLELDLVFHLAGLSTDGLLISPDSFLLNHSKRLAELAMLHHIPAIYQYREFVEAGGLASYGGSSMQGYRLLGLYTSRLLRGESPANLPVQQYATMELIINLKTVKTLGISIPESIQAFANEVIE